MSGEMDVSQSVTESLPDAPAKQSFRSFKKKYAKLKIKFELGSRESDELVREELRIEDLSKRIQAQNDQLLEVLLEFNDSLHVEPNLRFDLNAPEDASSLPTAERDLPANNDQVATTALQNAKEDMVAGRINPQDYHGLEDAVKRGRAFAPTNDYPSLLKVPHTAPQSDDQRQSAEGKFEDSLGFLTPEHETGYYLAMDARLGDEAATLQLNRAPEKPLSLEREREAALRNPVSVYNWLRRNQPHIFLQDNEHTSEKSATRPSRSKKAQARKEEEFDEDTASMDTGPTSNPKNKRKRDEDSGYRPKGGGGRSRKKKDDGTSNSRRTSKRASGTGA